MADDIVVSKRIRPLTKRKLETGEVYFRPKAVERQIEEVLMLSHNEITERIRVRSKNDPRYIYDETIVYLLREYGTESHSDFVNELCGQLSIRVGYIARSTAHVNPRVEDAEDMAQDAIGYLIERVFEGSDRADFAEVRFGAFISSFLSDKRSALQDRYNQDDKDDHLDEPVEDGFDHELSAVQFTSEETMILCSQLNALPEKTRVAIALIADGYQIESNNPKEITISKMMNVSSRTIRNWMNDAKQKLEGIRGTGR